jgi:pimeloyl-ACP methyl ester carboxylesterase
LPRIQKHRLRRLFVATAGLMALGLAGSWAAGEMLTNPDLSDVADARPPARDIRLRSADGVSLAGTYWPGNAPDAPGVLLIHGSDSSREAMAGNAAWLAGQGYAAMTVDLRGYGESDSARHSFGMFESRDAAAAFAWLKQRQKGAQVAVIGGSLGGAAALLGDYGPVEADALILQAVYPDIRRAIRNRIADRLTEAPATLLEPLLSLQARLRLGVRPSRIAPLAALGRYRRPVLVIGGGEDRSTPPAETRELFEAAPGPKILWLMDGIGHAEASNPQSEAYRRRVLAFLGKAMRRP